MYTYKTYRTLYVTSVERKTSLINWKQREWGREERWVEKREEKTFCLLYPPTIIWNICTCIVSFSCCTAHNTKCYFLLTFVTQRSHVNSTYSAFPYCTSQKREDATPNVLVQTNSFYYHIKDYNTQGVYVHISNPHLKYRETVPVDKT